MIRKLILTCALIVATATATSSCIFSDLIFAKTYVKVPPYRLLGIWERGDKAIRFTVYPDGRVLQKTGARYDMGTWDPTTGFTPYFPSEIKEANTVQSGARPGGTTVAEDAIANGDPDNWLSNANESYYRIDESACVPKQSSDGNVSKRARNSDSAKTENSFCYIDVKGNTVAPGPFLYASDFKDGTARVLWTAPEGSIQLDTAISKDGQYLPLLSVARFRSPGGLMSAVGFPVVPQGYIKTALAADIEGTRDLRLLVNPDGQLSDEPVAFEDDQYNTKFGFIGTDGKILIDKKFDYADNFHEGLAVVMIGNEYRYIGPDGDFAFSRKFQFAESFSDGLAPYIEDDLWGYIDRKGNTIIKPQFEYAKGFHDGLAAVRKDHVYAFIDKTGQVRRKTKFYGAKIFTDGLIPVLCDNGLWGYADKDGVLEIEPRFKVANPFSEGRAAVIDAESGGESSALQKARQASRNFVLGQALAGAGEPLKARKYLEMAVKSGDKVISPKAERYLGVRMLDFATAESVRAYKSIIDQSEKNALANAEVLARKAINDYPEFYQLHLALADVYMRQHRFSDADKVLQLVIQQRPDYSRAYVMQSRSASDQGNIADAIKYAKLAVEKDPLDFWVQSNKIKLLGF